MHPHQQARGERAENRREAELVGEHAAAEGQGERGAHAQLAAASSTGSQASGPAARRRRTRVTASPIRTSIARKTASDTSWSAGVFDEAE